MQENHHDQDLDGVGSDWTVLWCFCLQLKYFEALPIIPDTIFKNQP